MSLKNTSQLIPQFGIEEMVKTLAPSNYTGDKVMTAFPEVIRNISSIWAATPPEVVRAQLIWKVISGYSSVVSAPEIEPVNRFFRKLAGKVLSPTLVFGSNADLLKRILTRNPSAF